MKEYYFKAQSREGRIESTAENVMVTEEDICFVHNKETLLVIRNFDVFYELNNQYVKLYHDDIPLKEYLVESSLDGSKVKLSAHQVRNVDDKIIFYVDGEIAHIFRHVERVECLGPRTQNVS